MHLRRTLSVVSRATCHISCCDLYVITSETRTQIADYIGKMVPTSNTDFHSIHTYIHISYTFMTFRSANLVLENRKKHYNVRHRNKIFLSMCCFQLFVPLSLKVSWNGEQFTLFIYSLVKLWSTWSVLSRITWHVCLNIIAIYPNFLTFGSVIEMWIDFKFICQCCMYFDIHEQVLTLAIITKPMFHSNCWITIMPVMPWLARETNINFVE